jgi:site-specific DNA-methyltransferase (adenine-specific)
MSTQVDLFTNVEPTSVSPAIAKPFVSRSTFYQGDFFDESENIKSGSVDLILTDLPYQTMKGIKNPLRPKSWGREQYFLWDEIDLSKVISVSERILRKNGKAIFFYGSSNIQELINSQTDTLSYQYKMIWEKNEFGNVLMCNKAPVNYYEDVLVFKKNYDIELSHPLREYFKNVCEFIGLPPSKINSLTKKNTNHFFRYKSKHFLLQPQENYNELINMFQIDKMNGFKSYSELSVIDKEYQRNVGSVFNLLDGNKYKSNVLKYNRDKSLLHPTQKPVLLLEDLIKTFSNENDLVVDLTMGSGSTGVACKKTGRHFIGIEKDPKYFEIAVSRVSAYCG